MRRLSTWVARLEKLLASNAKRPFVYGDWDCCIFICAAIEAITGTNPAPWLGGYTTEAEGLALAGSKLGSMPASIGEAVAAIADAVYLKPCQIGMAKRGDLVVLRQSPDSFVCGIVALNGLSLMFVSSDGIRSFPLAKLSSAVAWNIG